MSNTNQGPRRKAGGGMFFLIVLAIGAFLVFSNMGNPGDQGGDVINNAPQGTSPDDNYSVDRERILDIEQSNAGKQMPSTGKTGAAEGWDMQDVETKRNSGSFQTGKSGTSKTTQGDWSLEDVDGKKKDDNQFRFTDDNKKAAPKTNGGDWSIDTNSKPNKKTEKGDWAIEETGTTKKK